MLSIRAKARPPNDVNVTMSLTLHSIPAKIRKNTKPIRRIHGTHIHRNISHTSQ